MKAGEFSTGWRLCRARPRRLGAPSRWLPEEFQNLANREEEAGLRQEEIFLLRPNGTPDHDVSAYLHDRSFRRLSGTTQESYAKDLRTHFNFLFSQDMDWRNSTVESFEDYEYWRRRDERNPARISGAKFSRELAACRRFYEWQTSRGNIVASPIEAFTDDRSTNKSGISIPLSPKNARNNRVKWLTPEAFRQWKIMGLSGYGLDGLQQSSWRGRNEDRNAGFADLLWNSGLRLREGATLLSQEIPEMQSHANFHRARLSTAVAKGRGRNFWVSREALQSVEAYRMTSRAEAVGKAQKAGRYDDIPGKLILHSVDAARRAKLVGDNGQLTSSSLDDISVEERERLFIQVGGGIEPAMVWLTESGMPMKYTSWEMVFETASRRCRSQLIPIDCTPHMLRHSFALRMLVSLIHASDSRLGITAEERREYRMLFGDPWVLVQTMLGHANVEMTQQVYLEPIQGLQVELFLNARENNEQSFSAILAEEIMSSPLVNKGVDKHGKTQS